MHGRWNILKYTNPLGQICLHSPTRFGLDGYHQRENYFVKGRNSNTVHCVRVYTPTQCTAHTRLIGHIMQP